MHTLAGVTTVKASAIARDRLKLLGGPIAALALGDWALAAGLSWEISITLAITLWCALWWLLGATANAITERVPVALAVLSASCSFMLPAATAPSAIAFGSGQVTTAQMLRHGAVRNLIGVGVVGTVGYWLLR